eukprot:2607490-Prymnesium_polylepis.1
MAAALARTRPVRSCRVRDARVARTPPAPAGVDVAATMLRVYLYMYNPYIPTAGPRRTLWRSGKSGFKLET